VYTFDIMYSTSKIHGNWVWNIYIVFRDSAIIFYIFYLFDDCIEMIYSIFYVVICITIILVLFAKNVI